MLFPSSGTSNSSHIVEGLALRCAVGVLLVAPLAPDKPFESESGSIALADVCIICQSLMQGGDVFRRARDEHSGQIASRRHVPKPPRRQGAETVCRRNGRVWSQLRGGFAANSRRWGQPVRLGTGRSIGNSAWTCLALRSVSGRLIVFWSFCEERGPPDNRKQFRGARSIRRGVAVRRGDSTSTISFALSL